MPRDARIGGTPTHQLPTKLLMGEFTLEVDHYTDPGHLDPGGKRVTGASGQGWADFDCAGAPAVSQDMIAVADALRLGQSLEVVAQVIHPQTQIILETARAIQPDIRIGQTLHIEATVTVAQLQEIVQVGKGVIDWLATGKHRGQILVEFTNVTIEAPRPRGRVGKITDGAATWPVRPAPTRPLRCTVGGFALTIRAITFAPHGASADVTVEMPGKIASADSCTPGTLQLGMVPISRSCSLYVEQPAGAFGPWMVGDTGMVIQGTGYVVDLSLNRSPAGKPDNWRGVLLGAGSATGHDFVPEPCNTGYLRGGYGFAQATVTEDGLDARFDLSTPHTYRALHPIGYTLAMQAGHLDVEHSAITGGQFGPGTVELPISAVCDSAPGHVFTAKYASLTVNSDLDLAGEADCSGRRLGWGELTRGGAEALVWLLESKLSFVYLPAGALPSFVPEASSGFLDLAVPASPAPAIACLQAHGVAGLTLPLGPLDAVSALSPDRPGGAANPLRFSRIDGWLRVGSRGVDGEIRTYDFLAHIDLGEPARAG